MTEHDVAVITMILGISIIANLVCFGIVCNELDKISNLLKKHLHAPE